MEEVAKIAQAPLESPCTAMGLLGNWALLQSILPLPCSPAPYPTFSWAPFPLRICFQSSAENITFIPTFLRKSFPLLQKLFICGYATYVAQHKKCHHNIYSNDFSTSPPRTALNESVLGLTTLNKKTPKKPNKNYLSTFILIEQTQFDSM